MEIMHDLYLNFPRLPLKLEIHLNNVQKFGTSLTQNRLCLHYKHQPVNAFWANNLCVFEYHMESINIFHGQNVEYFLMLK
jgi:hypothetical protein